MQRVNATGCLRSGISQLCGYLAGRGRLVRYLLCELAWSRDTDGEGRGGEHRIGLVIK